MLGTVAKGCTSISIHTPVKGVTVSLLKHSIQAVISIHTPVKGVTPINASNLRKYAVFQSTHP